MEHLYEALQSLGYQPKKQREEQASGEKATITFTPTPSAKKE
jgi:transposase